MILLILPLLFKNIVNILLCFLNMIFFLDSFRKDVYVSETKIIRLDIIINLFFFHFLFYVIIQNINMTNKYIIYYKQ